MPTLKDVFADLNSLKGEGLVEAYAIGGATAVLFYAEHTRTYDLDVFVLLPHTESALISLSPFSRVGGATASPPAPNTS